MFSFLSFFALITLYVDIFKVWPTCWAVFPVLAFLSFKHEVLYATRKTIDMQLTVNIQLTETSARRMPIKRNSKEQQRKSRSLRCATEHFVEGGHQGGANEGPGQDGRHIK